MLRRVLLSILLLCCIGFASAASPSNEVHCMVTTVYGEARGEPTLGQALIVATILNRTTDPRWPDSICGVVSQRRQFDGFKPVRSITTLAAKRAWAAATRVTASVLTSRTRLGRCGRATHFHATYVNPPWARSMTRLCQVGNHIFYEET